MVVQRAPIRSTRRRTPAIRRLWLTWIAFVVYGSLVPLDFMPLPLSTAWASFAQSPWLQLGVASRADWVANGVLYLPVGFLGAASLLTTRPRGASGSASAGSALALAFAIGVALAVAVEFTQVFFPPRTVSLNDLFAEAIGTLLGALAARFGTERLRRLIAGFATGGAPFLRKLAPAYAFGYLALALFPYDVLVSADEWAQKLRGANVGWWLAESGRGVTWSVTVAKLLLEVVAVMPIGAWWMARPTPTGEVIAHRTLPWMPALALGGLLGLVIEIVQLCIGSGVSQGVSVLTRSLGFAIGVAIFASRTTFSDYAMRNVLRRATLPLLALYLLALTALHGWWRGAWVGIEQAWQRLAELHYLPFYYHYFTTEMQAVTSLLAAACSYAPVAVFCWAWYLSPGVAALTAAMLALVVEVGRLTSADGHPDPTNLLIAATSAWAFLRLIDAVNANDRPPRQGVTA